MKTGAGDRSQEPGVRRRCMPSECWELKTKNYRAVAGSKIIARVAGIWNEKYGLALVGFNWVWGAQSQLFCPSLSPQAIYS